MTDGPLIVQSDKTLLLEVDHPLAQEARAAISEPEFLRVSRPTSRNSAPGRRAGPGAAYEHQRLHQMQQQQQ